MYLLLLLGAYIAWNNLRPFKTERFKPGVSVRRGSLEIYAGRRGSTSGLLSGQNLSILRHFFGEEQDRTRT